MKDLIEALNRAQELDEATTSIRVPAAIREYVDAYCDAINNMKGYNEDKWDRGTGGEFHAYGKPSSAYADRVMYGVIDNYDLSEEEYNAVYMYVEFQEELEWYDDPNVKNEFDASCVQDDDEDDLDNYDDYDDWDDDDDDFDEALNRAHELDEQTDSLRLSVQQKRDICSAIDNCFNGITVVNRRTHDVEKLNVKSSYKDGKDHGGRYRYRFTLLPKYVTFSFIQDLDDSQKSRASELKNKLERMLAGMSFTVKSSSVLSGTDSYSDWYPVIELWIENS